MRGRHRWVRAVVALALVLAAGWEAAHVVRTERDARLTAICASIAGGPETDAATRFAAEGLRRETNGGNTVSYSVLTSWLQSFSCVAVVDPSGRITRAFPMRMTRQEAYTPWRDSAGWSAVGRALVAASVPLTP